MKHFSRLLLPISSCCIFLALDWLLNSVPSFGAQKLVLKYGLFERSLSVSDIRKYADKQEAPPELKPFLGYFSTKQEKLLREALKVKISLDIGALDQLLDTEIGQQALNIVSQVIVFPNGDTNSNDRQIGIKALRSAFILGASSSEGLGIVNFLEAYPTENIVFDVSKIYNLISISNVSPGMIPTKDTLSDSPIWQLGLQYFQIATKGKRFSACLFGDSITAEFGNKVGINNFNFAFEGLSTVTLVEQLQVLATNQVSCQKAVIAVGGNDAWYTMSDDAFRQKLQESIGILRKMKTKDIYLVPAFNSTVAGSKDPTVAASLERIIQINQIINQVGDGEKIPVLTDGVAPLYENNALKDNLSSDGDHLNEEGLKIYKAALKSILGS